MKRTAMLQYSIIKEQLQRVSQGNSGKSKKQDS
jgi:hypothetical protein